MPDDGVFASIRRLFGAPHPATDEVCALQSRARDAIAASNAEVERARRLREEWDRYGRRGDIADIMIRARDRKADER